MGTKSFEEKALPYLCLGWAVFPMRPATRAFFAKEGGGPGGFYWATLNREKIVEWSHRWPDANIALRTGAISGVVCVDLDFGKPGSNTQEAIDRLAQRGFSFPPANVEARTPSGGAHWYYRYVGPLQSSASRLGATLMGKDGAGKDRKSGIDIRADGGLAILPPSFVVGKGDYTWVKPPFDGRRLPPLPRWIMDQLKTPVRDAGGPYVAPIRNSPGEIPEWRLQKVATTPPNTSRNSELFKQAAQAADWGHSHTEIEHNFTLAALASGLNESDARKTIAQALMAKNRRDPRRRSS